MTVDPELLKILVCPVCKGRLDYRRGSVETLDCGGCRKSYPVREGVPVMLAEEAKTL